MKNSNITWLVGLRFDPPISKGGLGIQNLKMFCMVLLGKWLWCFVHERGMVENCCGCEIC